MVIGQTHQEHQPATEGKAEAEPGSLSPQQGNQLFQCAQDNGRFSTGSPASWESPQPWAPSAHLHRRILESGAVDPAALRKVKMTMCDGSAIPGNHLQQWELLNDLASWRGLGGQLLGRLSPVYFCGNLEYKPAFMKVR